MAAARHMVGHGVLLAPQPISSAGSRLIWASGTQGRNQGYRHVEIVAELDQLVGCRLAPTSVTADGGAAGSCCSPNALARRVPPRLGDLEAAACQEGLLLGQSGLHLGLWVGQEGNKQTADYTWLKLKIFPFFHA